MEIKKSSSLRRNEIGVKITCPLQKQQIFLLKIEGLYITVVRPTEKMTRIKEHKYL